MDIDPLPKLKAELMALQSRWEKNLEYSRPDCLFQYLGQGDMGWDKASDYLGDNSSVVLSIPTTNSCRKTMPLDASKRHFT